MTVLESRDWETARPRQPEKARLHDTPRLKKPGWIRVRAPGVDAFEATRTVLRDQRLTTVCEEASCPNIGECWGKRHATFMILGETEAEIVFVMDDLRDASVDFLTIGQYLQPTPKHAAIDRFVTPEEFQSYKRIAEDKGFLLVASSPLTRSSYHAAQDFAQLKAARQHARSI